jgi:NAD(P)-dependent dehydrogenase (short-subunit alcohol dehydrogenase family)
MDLRDKVVVVTGAGSGIGEAMARRFAKESPEALVLGDLDVSAARDVAEEIGGEAYEIDVADEDANRELVEYAEGSHGPIDLFCANAGYAIVGDEQADAREWDRMWHVNLMSHVYAAKALVPSWVARGKGYFLSTASAAGLLTNLKAAQYSVTKHAAVAFAEWLAITYGDAGIRVSCLCPQFVDTPLLTGAEEFKTLGGNHVLTPEEVADAVVAGLQSERFLILPHPEVATFFQNKANDYDRWIGGMRKLQRSVFPE